MNKETRDLIFGYASFAGTFLAICGLIYSIKQTPPASNNTEITLLTLCFMNMFLAVSATYIVRRYDKLHQVHSKAGNEIAALTSENDDLKASHKIIAKVFHNINHEARILIQTIKDVLTTKDQEEFKETETKFREYMIFFLNNVKEVFDVVTRDQCSVCIKLIEPNETNTEQSYITTHSRDAISYRERSTIDKDLEKYPYYENMAFNRLLNKKYADKYYICNDLQNERPYTNINPNWKKYYNACLVVPISLPYKDIDGKKKRIIIGFLCVDNLKGGFDELVAHDLLAAIADLQFIVFSLFDDLKTLFDKTQREE